MDLGITVSNDMSPRLHVNSMVAKAHKRANAIHRCFISKDVSTLIRAFVHCVLKKPDPYYVLK